MCTNPLLRTVCSASNPEMNSKSRKKKTRNNTPGCCWYEFTNSDLGILGFGATQRDRQGSQEGDTQARETRKKSKHPKRKLADTVAHQSLLVPIQIFFLWYGEFVLNSLIFVENPSKFLNAGLLLLSTASFFDACEAKRVCGTAALLEVIISSSLVFVMVIVSSF